jgi:hypothetical protein
MVQQDERPRQPWKEFYRVNCDALFQTALLLSADPEVAEEALIAGIGSADASTPPGSDEFLVLQTAIVTHSIRNAGIKASANSSKARSMLQAGLRPILQLEGSSRVCFVLRVLLGCATSSCAQLLGMEEDQIKRLLRAAILQLHRAVAAENTNDLAIPPPNGEKSLRDLLSAAAE